MAKLRFTRKEFLKATGATALALSMGSLGFLDDRKAYATEKVLRKWDYGSWEDLFRDEWTWDTVTPGVHLVDCYNGNCPFMVYSRDGIVWREEQRAAFPVVDPNGPDWNPKGCQKGCNYSSMMYNPDRIMHPMKRVSERGEGKWKRITWEEAATEFADAVLNAIEEEGPESVIFEPGPGNGGWFNIIPATMCMGQIGSTVLDVNATIGDFFKGIHETFGKFQFVESYDGMYFSKLTLVWGPNPVYTIIPQYHFMSESRYNGCEVITIAPDYSPSTIHADEWVPVEPATDAALALGIGQVLMTENLFDKAFVKEQTDLPLLVRTDTERFLRERDLVGDGLEDQFYFYDTDGDTLVKAPKDTLNLPAVPSLEGTYTVTLADGSEVEVRPSFALLKEMLDRDYTPEKASKLCGVHPDTIRRLAQKAAKAKGHMKVVLGYSLTKLYHGDLIVRSLCLLLALTGSIGKKGSGISGWSGALFGPMTRQLQAFLKGPAAAMMKQAREAVKATDPTMTEEMLLRELALLQSRQGKGSVPPVFLYYFHSGYRDTWDKKEWHDGSLKRSFDDYLQEAIDKGWWQGRVRPTPDQTPQVYVYQGTNPARKNRGWWKNIYPSLWKKYKFILRIDVRFSSTCLMSDMILPAAGYYEKLDVRFPTPHVPWLVMTDRAVEPVGESKEEWNIWKLLAETLETKAKERGMLNYMAGNGQEISLEGLVQSLTMGCTSLDEVMDQSLQIAAENGSLPEGTSLESLRETGFVRFTDVPAGDLGSATLATDIQPDEPLTSLTFHTGPKKIPYPSVTRRIQFYIDHEWFLESGEGHPVHKETPKIGGDYPLWMSTGHQRWSIHTSWVTNEELLQTHQGRPFMFIHPGDARKRGIVDGDMVRVFNDFDDFKVHVKLSPAARPGQVMIYHAWEPVQFENWKSYDSAIPGMIKWNDLAGGYAHLEYYSNNWCTQPIDKPIAVEVQKA